VDLVLTAEVTAADGTDDNDANGNAEGDNSMVGWWERRLRRSRSSKRGLKDGERRRLALVAVHRVVAFVVIRHWHSGRKGPGTRHQGGLCSASNRDERTSYSLRTVRNGCML